MYNGPSQPSNLFMRWLANQVKRGMIQITPVPPGQAMILNATNHHGSWEPAGPSRVACFTLTLAAAKRFIIGSDDGELFIGCQAFDHDPLAVVLWSLCEVISEDRYGSAWLRLCSSPLRMRENPDLQSKGPPVMVCIPIAPSALEAIPGFRTEKEIVLRKTQFENGVMKRLGKTRYGRTPLLFLT